MVRVTLTPSEFVLAAQVGARRRVANLLVQRHGAHGAPDAWGPDIEGACAECAAAKALGVYWLSSVSFSERQAGDLAGGIEVRATERADGCLLLHPRDHDDRPYVLVTGRAPTFVVVGFVFGRDGKRPEWWREDVRSPAWFVPQAALRGVGELGR